MVFISSFGVNFWGLYYSVSEILREGWLQRSTDIARPQHLEAAYDPVLVDTIYLFPQVGSRVFWRCNLRSEERRVGKECRSRWWTYRKTKKKNIKETER